MPPTPGTGVHSTKLGYMSGGGEGGTVRAPGLEVARLGLCHEARPQLGGREMGWNVKGTRRSWPVLRRER